MNQFTEMMHEPNHDMYDDVPSHTERHLLTIGLYLSYLACLAGLWLISAVLGQTHALFPDIFGLGKQSESMSFALLIVPLFVLCACYIRLRRMTGKIMQLPERKLDERQRLIRDRAHLIAYRIITVLCLAILAYVCLHSMLQSASPLPPPPPLPAPGVVPSGRSVTDYIVIPNDTQSLSTIAVAPSPSTDPLSQGLYYGLFLATMFLIVKTLPTAVIGWRERG